MVGPNRRKKTTIQPRIKGTAARNCRAERRIIRCPAGQDSSPPRYSRARRAHRLLAVMWPKLYRRSLR